MLVIVSVDPPIFTRTTDRGLLVVPLSWLPNAMLVGVRDTAPVG